MKKTIRGLLVCMAVMTALILGMTGAEAETEATTFDEFKTAVAAGGTVGLGADITLTGDVHIHAVTTIDLNGHVLNTQTYRIAIYDCPVTLKDSGTSGKVLGAGTVFQVGEVNENGYVHGGTLNVESGTIVTSTKNAVYVMPESSFTISGGSITASSNAIISEGSVNITGGSVNATSQTVTLKSTNVDKVDTGWNTSSQAYFGTLSMGGGTVKATNKTIALEKGCAATINGGTVTAVNEAILDKGTVTINGGTVKATGETAVIVDWPGKAVIKNGTIQAPDYTLYVCGDVTIEGGSITATAAEATALYIVGCDTITDQGPAGTGKAEIFGGTIKANGTGAMAAYVTGLSDKLKGSLILNSGTLQGNGADGAGIYLDDNGTADINGGTISAVMSGNGGQGVYIGGANTALRIRGGNINADQCGVMVDSSVTPEFTLRGNPAFNTTSTDNCDLEIQNLNTVIEIDGALTNIAPISVRLGGNRAETGVGGVFTKNYSDHNTADPDTYFTTVSGSAVEWDAENQTEAYLTGHVHQFEYSWPEDRSRLTAVCKNDGCYLEESELTVELIAPDPVYNEQEKLVSWTPGIYMDAFPGLGERMSCLEYDPTTDEWNEMDGAPAEPGRYRVVYTLAAGGDSVYIETEFEIYRAGNIQIAAVDEAGNGLPGVRFRVENTGDPDWGRDEWISDQYNHYLYYLKPGDEYVIYAEDVPDGYLYPEDILFGCDGELTLWSDPEGLLSGRVLTVEFKKGYQIISDGTAMAYCYDDNANIVRITQAAPGDEVRIYFSDNAEETIEDDLYLTGAYEVDNVPLGYDQNGEPVDTIEMPAHDIAISAVKGVREAELRVGLQAYTGSNEVMIPVEALESIVYGEETCDLVKLADGHYELDVDGSGNYDVGIWLPGGATRRGDCETWMVPWCDAFGEYSFEFDGPMDRYEVITFVLTKPVYGTPTITLPAGLTEIQESVFEGNKKLTVVYAGDEVASIGKNAFVGCTGLKQVRLPKNCAINDEAFDEEIFVQIFAPAGGTTEAWCRRMGLMFVAE